MNGIAGSYVYGVRVLYSAFKFHAFLFKALSSQRTPKAFHSRLLVFICGSFILLFTGCTTVPFESEPEGDFREIDPEAVITDFNASVGRDFELLQSVVFRFFGKGFTGLGYLSVDPDADTYALSCMSPAGLTLFELKGEGDKIDALFIPPQLEKHGERIAASMGRDLRRIYFDWRPPEEAALKRKRDRLVFKSERDDETVEHTFSGVRRLLTEKRFSEGWKTRCIVHYYEYEEINGKLYPRGIMLYNKQFHYRMELRLKTVYPKRDDGS